MRLFRFSFIAALLCPGVLFAQSARESVIAVTNRALVALRGADASAVLSTFAAAERNSAAVKSQIGTFAASPVTRVSSAVDAGSTGNSDAELNGVRIEYLFGNVATTAGPRHFTADAILEGSAWHLTRLFVEGAGTLGSDRYTYDKVPKVNDAVQSMVSGESVLNQFMRAAERNDIPAALACWIHSERNRPAKAAELKALFQSKQAYFRGFQQVDEGRTGFGFEGPKNSVRVVKADGKMTYKDGSTRNYKATLVREDGGFKIKELSF